jgi:hypothetical protein
MLEVRGLAAPKLLETVLVQVQRSVQRPPDPEQLRRVATGIQQRWTEVTGDGRALARALAVRALLWPELPVRLAPPDSADAAAVRDLLAAVFAGQPVVVEGRP